MRAQFHGFPGTYHRAVAVEPDAKPTIEALEAERRRLKELERNLAAERNRVQEDGGTRDRPHAGGAP